MEHRARFDTLRRLSVPGLGLAALAIGTSAAFASGLLEPVSLAITVGGALAVERATFSRRRIVSTWERLCAALREPADPESGEIETIIDSVKRLTRIYRIEGAPGLDRAAMHEANPLVRSAVQRALECNDPGELRDVLLGEARREVAEGEAARHVLVTLGKLFPAFGLIGTLIGLALLLPKVGSADVAAIGPHLGVAVLTTLYGAVLSNAVVLPLATKLQGSVERRWVLTQMILCGVEQLHRREYPTRVERAMRAFMGLAAPEAERELVVLTERAA